MEPSEHMSACCEPQVQVTGDVPVDIIPSSIKCVVDMTEEEREAHFKERGEEHYKHYLAGKASGAYSRCRKTDWCKVEREKKEKEQKEKERIMERLAERNVVLEAHGREMEAKVRKMEASMEKLAGLLAQLMPK